MQCFRVKGRSRFGRSFALSIHPSEPRLILCNSSEGIVMKIVCVNPPRFVKCFLKLFRRNKKKPAVSDGQCVDKR